MPTSTLIPTNLPPQVTTFVDREREMSDIERLLGKHRLVTLTGTGGTGKTRLALEIAARATENYPDGVWFIGLSTLADPNLVPQAFAVAIGVGEQPGRSLLDTLVSFLSEKKVLLLVDNAEHVVEATAHVCEPLLARCPDLQILATGRSDLDLHGERPYRIPSMTMPDPKVDYSLSHLEQFEAVRLFIDRASRSDSEFRVSSENSSMLAHICHRIDGIPLAIELAAARVSSMSLKSVSDRIDERFEIASGRMGVMPRQQTLRAMIGWSYDLLSESEQLLLRRASVFADGFTRQAAEAVCADPVGYGGLERQEVLMGLEDLFDKALVQFDEATYRYSLLETVRSYARDALEETLEAYSIRTRHLNFYREYAKSAEPFLSGPDALIYLDKLNLDRENTRTALDWGAKGGHSLEALELACRLSTYYHMRGMFEEGCMTYANLLRQTGDQANPIVAEGYAAQGALLMRQGQYGRARAQLDKSLRIFDQITERQGMGRALNTLAAVELQLGEYEAAKPRLEQALELARAAGDEPRVAMTLNNLGIVTLHLGDVVAAKRLYEEALEVNRRTGNQRQEAGNLNNLADIECNIGDPIRARELARDACRLHLKLADMLLLQESFEVLAATELKCGRPYIATIVFASKESMMTELGAEIAPFSQDEYRVNVSAARQALGEEAFRAAFTEGRSLTPMEAFRASLEDL